MKYELTPFEHRILDRLLKGAQLIDPHERAKPKFIFLCSHKDDPVRCWELVPRATLNRFIKCELIVAQETKWCDILNAQITPYIL